MNHPNQEFTNGMYSTSSSSLPNGRPPSQSETGTNGFGFHPLTFVSHHISPDGRIMYIPPESNYQQAGYVSNLAQLQEGSGSGWSSYVIDTPENQYFGNHPQIYDVNGVPVPTPLISSTLVHHMENGRYAIRVTGNVAPHCIIWDPYPISPLKQYRENQMKAYSMQHSSGYSSTPSSTGYQQQWPPIPQQFGSDQIQRNVSSSSYEVIVEEPDVSEEPAQRVEPETIEFKIGLVTKLVDGLQGLNEKYDRLVGRMENVESGKISFQKLNFNLEFQECLLLEMWLGSTLNAVNRMSAM